MVDRDVRVGEREKKIAKLIEREVMSNKDIFFYDGRLTKKAFMVDGDVRVGSSCTRPRIYAATAGGWFNISTVRARTSP